MSKEAQKIDSLSSRIALAINNTGDTYELLAKNLGVSRNTIMTYKKCKGDIKGVVIENLAVVYDFSPLWLLTGEGSIHRNEQAREREAGEEICQNSNAIVLDGQDPPPDNRVDRTQNLSVVVQEHICLIPQFKDKETAKAANEKLLELERISERNYRKAINHINILWEATTDAIEDYQSSQEAQGGAALGRQKNGTRDP